jgi:hypothetical protein
VKKNVITSTSCNIALNIPEPLVNEYVLPVNVNFVNSVNSVLRSSVLNPLANPFNSHLSNARNCSTLRSLRVGNTGNIIIGHLNINSVGNKFDSLVELIEGNLDVLIIGESKLDKSFPKAQFKINGFTKPYRRDRNKDGGGVMIYVRNDIPSQEKEYKLPSNVEGVLVEINLRKVKFLLIGIYHSTNAEHGTSGLRGLHNCQIYIF